MLSRTLFEGCLEEFLQLVINGMEQIDHHYIKNGYFFVKTTVGNDLVEFAVAYDDVWLVPRCYFRRFDSLGQFIAEPPLAAAMMEMPPQIGTTWWTLHPCSTAETMEQHLGAQSDKMVPLEWLKYWFKLYGVQNVYTDVRIAIKDMEYRDKSEY